MSNSLLSVVRQGPPEVIGYSNGGERHKAFQHGWNAAKEQVYVAAKSLGLFVDPTDEEAYCLNAEMRDIASCAPDLLVALREIETICTESAADCRRRMGTRVGNALVAARAAIAKAEGRQ